MNYKYLIIGNASSFDSTISYIKSLNENGNQVDILFCCSNKYQIIEENSYIDNFIKDNHLNTFQLTNFFKSLFWSKVWQKLFDLNKFDFYKKKNMNPFAPFFSLKIINFIENKLGNFFLSKNKIEFFFSDTDILLIDFRHKYESYGKKTIENCFKNLNIKKIFLLPHACHYTRPLDEFNGYENKNTLLLPKKNIIFWIPMFYDELNNFKKYNFEVLGYPELKRSYETPINYINNRNVLILVRNFRNDNLKTNDNSFVYENLENYELFKRYVNIKNKFLSDKKIIFKLHPKISKTFFESFIGSIWPDDNYEIIYDSILGYLDNIFMSISTYSTVNILTISKKIPTIIINCRFQKYVNEWNLMNDTYNKLNFFCENNEILYKKVAFVINNDISEYLEEDRHIIQSQWLN